MSRLVAKELQGPEHAVCGWSARERYFIDHCAQIYILLKVIIWVIKSR
jgi:hypothetical protein